MARVMQETVEELRGILGSRLDEITVEDVCIGVFFSGVKLSTGQGGLCYTPIKMMPEAVCCPSSAQLMPNPGALRQRKAADYLEDIFAGGILKKTLGIATLNALSAYCYENGMLSLDVRLDEDAFDVPDLSQHRNAVVIGALVPILKKLLKAGVDFTVLEQDARTLKGKELDHYRPAEDYAEVLPQADLVFITGVTLINDTIDDLLAHIKPGAEVILAGPTLSFITNPLRRRGVTVVGGDYVKDADAALDILKQAGSGYHLFGKSVSRTVIRL